MKTFKNVCAQGDVQFFKRDKLPAGLKQDPAINNVIVVTHSETGHNHVMEIDRKDDPAVEMFTGDNPLISWIKVNRPTSLDHQKSYDVHESIMFDEGVYEVRRQREYTPNGFRRAQD